LCQPVIYEPIEIGKQPFVLRNACRSARSFFAAKMFVTPKIEMAVMLENNPGAKIVKFGVRQADDQ